MATTNFALNGDLFRANLWGGGERGAGAVFEQVKATMLVTVFVFLGIEGASVYSRYARKREDVGKATVLGFLGVLAIFSASSILSYGVRPKAELAGLQQPSMAGVLEAAVGTWGTVLISVGLIVSVLGAYLAWTLYATAELIGASPPSAGNGRCGEAIMYMMPAITNSRSASQTNRLVVTASTRATQASEASL
jgi:arginine:ornithine antiporter/lysine permease